MVYGNVFCTIPRGAPSSPYFGFERHPAINVHGVDSYAGDRLHRKYNMLHFIKKDKVDIGKMEHNIRTRINRLCIKFLLSGNV